MSDTDEAEADENAGGGGVPPPPANPTSYASANLRQSGIFGASPVAFPGRGRGGGRGRGRGRAESETAGDAPRFERLSTLAMELDGFREVEDEGSSLFSQSVRGGGGRRGAAGASSNHDKTDRMRSRELFGEDSENQSEDEDCNSNAVPRKQGRDQKHQKRARKDGTSSHSDMLAAAAFGGMTGGTLSPNHSSDDDCDDDDAASEVSSSAQNRAMKAAFPIKGVTCVGCALAHRIGPVECFVVENINRMAPDALYKFAALKYVTDVVDPAKKEGITVPNWSWKDLRTHFLLHNSDPRIARASTVNTLQTMRQAVESRLVRNDGGSRELDKSAADLMLKIIKSESTERSLLAGAITAGGGAGARAKAPGKSTVGDA